MLLALLATGLEGVNYVLLVPTIHALIGRDANLVRQAPYFKNFIGWIPSQITISGPRLLIFLIGFIFAVMLLKIFLQMVFNMSVMSQTKRFSIRLRFLIYERYLYFGKLFFDRNHQAHLQQILINHPRQIAQSLRVLHQTFYSTAMLVVSLAIMARISWVLTLITIIVWPILNFSIGGLIRQIRNSSVLFASANANLAKRVSNSLSCILLIKTSSSEEREKKQSAAASEVVEKMAVNIEKKQFLIGPIQEASGLVLIFLLMSLMACTLVDKNYGHIAAYLVFFIILRRSTSTLGSFSQIGSSIASMRGMLGEIDEIFSDNNKFYVADGDKDFGVLQNEICFKCLSFEYPGGARVLKEVSFEVKKGQMTALVGPTGAGKTTLIHLLMRFYESPKGTIFADGRDIRDFSLKSYYGRVAFISQDPLLFNETIRFNLTYGLETEASEEDVVTALKQARLYDLVMKFPQRLDTRVGDRGIRLSGGERQRLSIARALLRRTEILILDEATSALDSETEQLIQAAIKEVVRGKTTLVVAHRFSTIRDANHLVVLDEGVVVQAGTLNKLLIEKGLFSRLWKAQKFD